MMYLIPDAIASRIAEPSPSRPSASKPYHHQHGEKSSPSLVACCKSPSSERRRYYSSDEEDDSRDRQSHWKRIKTRAEDHPGRGRSTTRSLIRYTDRGRGHDERSPQQHQQAPMPRPGHRVILLKGSAHERDSPGLHHHRVSHTSESGRTGSGSKGWDGGTAPKDIDPGSSSKRKMSARRSRSPSMTSEVVGEKELTARRAPVEKGYEIRVNGEFVDGSLFLEDSRRVDDDQSARARIGSDPRESLNRRSRRGYYGDYDVGVRGKGSAVRKSLDVGRTSRSGKDDDEAERSSRASVGAKSGRDMESERPQEKRDRWAEKERDLEKELEKENMPKATLLPSTTRDKSMTVVVDYSHKFSLAKAPISTPAKPVEVDPHRLCQRQKQIDYGKNTLGYERYSDTVPRYQRTKAHPRTPDIRQVCSKRSWDGQIRKWRRLLHEYDPPKGEDEEDPDHMLAPRRQQEVSATDDDGVMDMQSEDADDADMKIYESWSDDEC